jgi:hypothetical protein
MQNQELFDAVIALQPQIEKVQTEITGKIAELEAALAAASTAEIPQAVVDAVAAVQVAVNALDAIVPDA